MSFLESSSCKCGCKSAKIKEAGKFLIELFRGSCTEEEKVIVDRVLKSDKILKSLKLIPVVATGEIMLPENIPKNIPEQRSRKRKRRSHSTPPASQGTPPAEMRPSQQSSQAHLIICPMCDKTVHATHRAFNCAFCSKISHAHCDNINPNGHSICFFCTRHFCHNSLISKNEEATLVKFNRDMLTVATQMYAKASATFKLFLLEIPFFKNVSMKKTVPVEIDSDDSFERYVPSPQPDDVVALYHEHERQQAEEAALIADYDEDFEWDHTAKAAHRAANVTKEASTSTSSKVPLVPTPLMAPRGKVAKSTSLNVPVGASISLPSTSRANPPTMPQTANITPSAQPAPQITTRRKQWIESRDATLAEDNGDDDPEIISYEDLTVEQQAEFRQCLTRYESNISEQQESIGKV